jgi:hypothetical protein
MPKAPRISLYFYKLSDFVMFCQGKHSVNRSVKNPETIYLPALPLIISLFDKNSEITTFIDKTRRNNTKIIIALPYIMRGKAAEVFKKNYENLTKLSDGFLLGNIGDSEIIKYLSEKTGTTLPKLYGDYSLNVTNKETAAYFSKNMESIALLPELDVEAQLALAGKFPQGLTAEICLGHNIIVMRSEHCFATEKEGYHCGRCGKQGDLAPALSDIHGNIYPLVCNPLDCNCIMLAPRSKKEETLLRYEKNLPENVLLRFSIV